MPIIAITTRSSTRVKPAFLGMLTTRRSTSMRPLLLIDPTGCPAPLNVDAHPKPCGARAPRTTRGYHHWCRNVHITTALAPSWPSASSAGDGALHEIRRAPAAMLPAALTRLRPGADYPTAQYAHSRRPIRAQPAGDF